MKDVKSITTNEQLPSSQEKQTKDALALCGELIQDFKDRADRHKRTFKLLRYASVALATAVTIVSTLTAIRGIYLWIVPVVSGLSALCTTVNARIILTAHFSYSFQQLTISKVLSYLFCSSRRSMQPPHPTAGRLHLDPLWWTAGAETSAREIDRRASSSALVSSAKPTTGIQVVRPAAPHGLDSLTPDARRAGPLHPRPHRFASCPSKASLAPG